MSSVPPAAPVRTQEPLLDTVFGALWPERDLAPRPTLVAASAGVGLLATVVLPDRPMGVAAFLVVLAVVAVLASAARRTPYRIACGVLVLLLGSMVVLRAAEWLSALSLLAAAGVLAVALTEARTVTGLLASGAAVPLAGIRGLPWLGRSLTPREGARQVAPLLRTAAVSLLLLVVFGALFGSADALVGRWLGALVPDLTWSTFVGRTTLAVLVAGPTLAGAYAALNPLRVERLALPEGRPVERAFEWLVPVGLVTALSAVFVAAQAAALFGGHAYLRRSTGLTYASYVHQGFGQLTVATVLTLGVVAAAVRKAGRASARDRLLLRALLGLLCLLTLVVVASALHRLDLYQQAYGYTRLRLLAAVVEGWLGLVVLLVMAAGLRLSGTWVPRAAALSAAGAVLLLGWANPDARIAEHDVARFQQTGKVDWAYLSGLSADAVPALAGLPAQVRHCARPTLPTGEDWLSWNLGRQRAGAYPQPASSPQPCPGG